MADDYRALAAEARAVWERYGGLSDAMVAPYVHPLLTALEALTAAQRSLAVPALTEDERTKVCRNCAFRCVNGLCPNCGTLATKPLRAFIADLLAASRSPVQGGETTR